LAGPAGPAGAKGDQGPQGPAGVADGQTAARLNNLESNTLQYGRPLYLLGGNGRYLSWGGGGGRASWEYLMPERP
jgi:hypothetical protein